MAYKACLSSKGFTLIEIFVVVLIMAIILGIASFSINVITQARTGKVRDAVLGMIEEARLRSITSVPHGVRCDGTTVQLLALRDGFCSHDNNIRCISDDECGGGNFCNPGDYRLNTGEETVIRESYQIPYGYTICCLNSCNAYTIWFDRKGVPRDASWGLGMTTVKINKGAKTLAEMTISAAGRVKYEK